MNSFPRLLISALCLTIAGAGEAAIYRWVDQHGRVHFGEHPPTDQAEQLDIRESRPPDQEPDMRQLDKQRGEKRRRLLETYREERELKRRSAEKRAQQEHQRQQNCVEARDRLSKYQRTTAIYETLEDGSRRFLSQVERDDELERMRQAVQHWCEE